MAKPKPFEVHWKKSQVKAVLEQVRNYPWPPTPEVPDGWAYGCDGAYLKDLCGYWAERYDWKAAVEELNRFPQFTARVEDFDIHFLHVVGEAGGKRPLILSHGWPGSVLEFLEAIPLLAARGYDVVVPSLPGYGFSGRPPRPIGASDIARMWRTLMVDVLGYRRFGAQGGDWGASVTTALAREHGDVVGAFHLNYLAHSPRGEMLPEEAEWLRQSRRRFREVGSYSQQMTFRPQTLGLALSDTPVGFASWVLEKYRAWSDNDGDIETAFTKDQLITSVMTYLVGDNVQASMWLYASMVQARPSEFAGRIAAPFGLAVFPRETQPPPRAAVESRFNIVHWQAMPKGGHFAAWEEPELFAGEVAGFFDRWR